MWTALAGFTTSKLSELRADVPIHLVIGLVVPRGRVMRLITATIIVLVLAGCSTGSGVLPSGPDTYTISERRAPVLGGAMKAKEVALTEANDFCQQKGKAFFTVSEKEGAFPAGNPWGNTDYAVTFRCAGAAVSDVDDLPLTDTQYRIIAKGGSSSEEVEDLVLLHASEVALKHGYRHFLINSTSDQSVTQVMTTPGSRTTNAGASVVGGSNFAMASGAATTTYTPASTTVLYKPGTAVFITLVPQGGLDARLIYDKLAPKYGRPPLP